MSYGDPRYAGESAEMTATFRPAATPADLRGPAGTFHYLATGAGTHGEFGLYKAEVPISGGAAAHFHRVISESFYVLSGALRFFDGRTWVDGRPGDFLYAPPGGLHAFRNESSEVASILMLFIPGAGREEYFERLTELASLSDEERLEFLVRHDSYFV